MAGVPVHVSPTWFIVAAVITIGFEPVIASRMPSLGNSSYLVSFAFAVLLYASVFLHELSHALVARWLGLGVRGITLHFLGGVTEIEKDSPTPRGDFLVSIAGPLVSLLTGGVGWLLMQVTDDVLGLLMFELAVANLLVGVFNLLPALPLDGGHVLRSVVWQITGRAETGTLVAAWAGRVLAVLVLVAPWVLTGGDPTTFGIIWAVLVASFIWSGSQQAVTVSRLRSRIPSLDPRRLARRALPVPPDLPVSEAVRQAQEGGAGALVVVDSAGRPTAIVNEAAVQAIPLERRPWVPVGSVSRSLEPGLRVRSDLAGEQLVQVMQDTPASEYLVVEPDGAVYGVLVTSDVDAALAASQH